MFELKNLNRFLIAGAVSLALSACGGGGNGGGGSPVVTPPVANDPPPSNNNPPPSNDNPPPESGAPEEPVAHVFSGVAAVGAPLVGSVTVRDALGATKTVQIGTNGSYSVDVADMTAPFVFRAVGRANGREYVVHSAATEADLNGTINITQLTDLVVSNIAGQIARDYFERGDFASLTKEALDAEAATLKTKLLPVLQALGVDASIDLLRTPFTPAASALDAALDILRVSFDADALVATITNIVTNEKISDDLTVPAAAENNPPQLTKTTNVTAGISDIVAIKAALEAFSDLFADGLPEASEIESKLYEYFRTEDRERADFAYEMSYDTGAVGMKFTDVDIKRIDYTIDEEILAIVDFTAMDAAGRERNRIRNFILVKVNDEWLLAGDGQRIETSANVLTLRNTTEDKEACVMTGIEFYIEDVTAYNSPDVHSISVHGPGLPDDGLIFERPAYGGWWPIKDRYDNYYVMANSCDPYGTLLSDEQIAAIPDDAVYHVAAWDAFGEPVLLWAIDPDDEHYGLYPLQIDKRPLTLAEALASDKFPTITQPSSAMASDFAYYTGGDLTVAVENLNRARRRQFLPVHPWPDRKRDGAG
jgi:hypothetical protein